MITNRDKLIDAISNNSSRLVFDKATITNQTAGTFVSLWQATGQPGAGLTPTSVAVCNNSFLGAFQFAQQTAPATSYLAYLEYASSNSAMTLEIHDRLAHMAGLSGTAITAQTVGINLNSLLATDNLSARIGDSNFSDVQWWLEWYVSTGATVANALVNVTYDDGSTGNLTTIPLAATRRNAFLQALNTYIPPASSGKFIRGVNSVTLSASTGTVGNFGITATRPRVSVSAPLLNFKASSDWASLPISEVPNSSCLFALVLTSTTSSGTARGGGKIVHG